MDAIVNAANTQLIHGGGLAGVIVKKGGSSIQRESSQWIKDHGVLEVGDAVMTRPGALPSKYIIHAVGPNVGQMTPTKEHALQLRRAVWSSLIEADRLMLNSMAIPGISTGLFGYPRDEGAQEIVREVMKFCNERGTTTTLRRIALMNIDDPTVKSFVKALQEEMQQKQVDETEDEGISEQLAALSVQD